MALQRQQGFEDGPIPKNLNFLAWGHFHPLGIAVQTGQQRTVPTGNRYRQTIQLVLAKPGLDQRFRRTAYDGGQLGNRRFFHIGDHIADECTVSVRCPRAAAVGRGGRCKTKGFPIDPTGQAFLQLQRQRLVFLACFDGGEGKTFSLHVRHSLPDGKGTEGGVIFIPAGLIAEIGIPLPPSAQHGNIHAAFPHSVQGQRHQLFHMAFAPGLRMDTDGAHIACLERILAHMHAAGQRTDHAANALLVHCQQMMPGALSALGIFLGKQGFKVERFVFF